MPHTQPKTTKSIAQKKHGHLAIPRPNQTRKYFKFCYWCGHKLKGELGALNLHFNAQHPDTIAAFLDFDLLPEACKYLNFEDFINGETSDLIEKPDTILNKGGRTPFQP